MCLISVFGDMDSGKKTIYTDVTINGLSSVFIDLDWGKCISTDFTIRKIYVY